MIAKLISDLLVFLASTIKFSYIMFIIIATKGSWHVILSNILGGIVGIVLFTFLGFTIEKLYIRLFPRRKFSKPSRFIVHVKEKFGVWGVALASPIISFPVAILIALTLTTHKWEIIKKMTLSLVLWSFVFYLGYFLIHYF